MSHVALRRVMVRLLHDPSFVERLHADPADALAGADVTAEEQAWLLATPVPAWGTDADRGYRLVAGLLDEYPGAAALAPERICTFLASDAFHRAVQGRGSLAAALGEHFAGDARAADVARLEAAIARVRRAPRRTAASGAGGLRLAERAAVLVVPWGTLERRESLRAGSDACRAPGPPVHLLIARVPEDGTVAVEELPAGLGAILDAAAQGPVAVAVLTAVARQHGAEPGEDAAIVGQLCDEGLLT